MKPFNIVHVAGSLYLSNKVWLERDLPILRQHGIGAIVNLVEDHAYEVPPPIACLNCGFPDGIYITPHDLQKIYDFIDLYRDRTNVLVHCSAGVSRSAGIVVGQLMKENPCWSWEQAFDVVNRKRSVWVAVEMRESVLSYLASERTSSPPSEILGSDAEVLQQLENAYNVRLQEVQSIGWNTRGFLIEDGHVVGLGLHQLDLTVFPEPIHRLTMLRNLCLCDNHLETLPGCIAVFDYLQNLNLSGNRLTWLPETIGDLTRLRVLNAACNRLCKIPDRTRNLHDLDHLYLHENCLTDLSEGLGELDSLTELYLQNNQLAGLPENIGNLSRLQRLALSGNEIRLLPKDVCDLPELIALNASKNRLTIVPPDLGRLTKLDNLNVSSNCLEELPEGITSLKNLRRLNIALNHFDILPSSIETWIRDLRSMGSVVIC